MYHRQATQLAYSVKPPSHQPLSKSSSRKLLSTNSQELKIERLVYQTRWSVAIERREN